ncbi:polymeric immunoglobulin receptor-like [Colossoma macropomum]|uniref:polymeric immunoglobulin receptor-like n=1 Tax=Colossoma macropomum TaxID=42526 RepID=UPI001864B1B6|nr:polymeric immunoglobulin receptor-like [Colossoma macropomum]
MAKNLESWFGIGCSLSETQEKLIIRYPGQSVLLPCSCTDQHTKPVSVKWEHVDSGGTEVSNETELYTGRVQMFNKNLPANLSLLISNLTEQDQGTYRCSINNKQFINISLSIKGCTLSETQEKLIIRSPGESVLLSCSCTDQHTKPVSVKWEHVDSGGTEVLNKMKLYRGRVHMFNKNLPANLSLLISNLTEQDQGIYRCSINNNQSINIRLSIKGCTLSETQEKLIIRSPGESVLLSCSCTDQHSKPVSVKWEHVDSGGTEVSNETPRYTGRVHMFNKNLLANLSLLISNLTEQDQGTYRCSINSKQSINISLNITDASRDTREPVDQMLIIIVCALLLILLLLLGGAAYTYWKYGKGRKKSNEKETGQRRNEDDITYSTVIHGGNSKPPQDQDNVTYSSVAHGKKDKAAKTEDVTYSSLVHGKKGKATQKQAEEDVTYSDVAFRKNKSAEQKDDVTYSSLVHGKKGKKTKKQAEEDVTYSDVAFCKAAKSSGQEDKVTISSVAVKAQKDAEEPTVYASVKPGKK